MTYNYRKLEGVGGEAIWTGVSGSGFPDFIVPMNFGPAQNRIFCYAGEVNVEGSIDGTNFTPIANLSAGESKLVSSRLLFVRCEPVGVDPINFVFSHKRLTVSRVRRAYNQIVSFSQPTINVSEIADVYFDEDTPYGGTSSDVTSINSQGTLGANFTLVGSGSNIIRESDGFYIPSDIYMRASGLSGTYDEATLVLQYTPNTLTGTLCRVDASLESRMILRLIADNPQALTVSNQLVDYASANHGIGNKNTLALNINFITKVLKIINNDGTEFMSPLDISTAQMVISAIDLGSGADCKFHKLGLFLAGSGETLDYTPYEYWDMVKN